MAARNRQRAAAPAAAAPVNALAEAGRTQAAAASECMAAMFRGFEEMRKVQESAAHAAAERHAVIAGKLRTAADPASVLALQAELMRFGVERFAQYWQALAAVGMEMQTRMLAPFGRLADSGALLEAASAFDKATDRAAGGA